MHGESTVKLVQLGHVEEQDRTLAQAEQDELFLLIWVRKGLLECLFVHPDVEHLRVEWQDVAFWIHVDHLHAGDLL